MYSEGFNTQRCLLLCGHQFSISVRMDEVAQYNFLDFGRKVDKVRLKTIFVYVVELSIDQSESNNIAKAGWCQQLRELSCV